MEVKFNGLFFLIGFKRLVLFLKELNATKLFFYYFFVLNVSFMIFLWKIWTGKGDCLV